MDDLIIGSTYTLTMRRREKDGIVVTRQRVQLVAMYGYHAVFRHQAGYMVSYQYWVLRKLLRGEVM